MTNYTTVCFHTNPKFSCTSIIELLRVDSIAFSIQRSHTPRSEAEIMFDLHSRPPERYSPCTTTTNQSTNRVPNDLYMPKKVYFGAKIILGGSKSSGIHTSENHSDTWFALFYWSGRAHNGSERPIFGPKYPKMHIMGQIWPFLGQKSYERKQKFCYPLNGKTT